MLRFVRRIGLRRIGLGHKRLFPNQHGHKRSVSALFVSGDKGTEHCAPLRPFMDFEGTFRNIELLKETIAQRQLPIDVNLTLEKYKKYLDAQSRIQSLEKERQEVAKQIKSLDKLSDPKIHDDLKERGKQLKNSLKQAREEFHPIENEFIQDFLNLPNTLHSACPREEHEKLIYSSSTPKHPKTNTHLQRNDLIEYRDDSCFYLFDEATEFDVNCMYALANHFVLNAGFTQTSNPDFVRLVLMEANATPIEKYHVVVDRHAEDTFNATFLAGGASFESFLGAMAKLCVYSNVLPLRLVSTGRNYEKVNSTAAKTPSLFTATQSNAVSTFVASLTAAEAEQHMEDILNTAVDFYKELGLHFRVVYTQASKLTVAEKLRAVIEVYSAAEERYIPVGHVSNYGDFVSKRILFVMQNKKEHEFLHLVGGPILKTTRLIAALIESNIKLEQVNLLSSNVPQEQSQTPNEAIKIFKNIFV